MQISIETSEQSKNQRSNAIKQERAFNKLLLAPSCKKLLN